MRGTQFVLTIPPVGNKSTKVSRSGAESETASMRGDGVPKGLSQRRQARERATCGRSLLLLASLGSGVPVHQVHEIRERDRGGRELSSARCRQDSWRPREDLPSMLVEDFSYVVSIK